MTAAQPGWLAAMDRAVAGALAGRAVQVSVALAAVFVVIAAGVYLPAPAARGFLTPAVAVAALMWAVGQDFGGIFTGLGTDPNFGPLLALLAATVSYLHMHALVALHGQPAWVALTPLSADGVIVAGRERDLVRPVERDGLERDGGQLAVVHRGMVLGQHHVGAALEDSELAQHGARCPAQVRRAITSNTVAAGAGSTPGPPGHSRRPVPATSDHAARMRRERGQLGNRRHARLARYGVPGVRSGVDAGSGGPGSAASRWRA